MNLWFETITVTASVASGLVSIVITMLTWFFSKKSMRSKLHEAQEEEFRRALGSDKLTEIGSYLDKNIGNFNLYEYVSNPNVSNKIDIYLEKVRSFVGTDTEVEQQAKETKSLPKIKERLHISDPFDRILTELRSGETWTALARLRRYIEINLRKIAKAQDIPLERATAGQLLNILSRRGLIPGEILLNLRYAIAVCNKAIHGVEISWDEAEAAVLNANFALGKLKQAPEPNPDGR